MRARTFVRAPRRKFRLGTRAVFSGMVSVSMTTSRPTSVDDVESGSTQMQKHAGGSSNMSSFPCACLSVALVRRGNGNILVRMFYNQGAIFGQSRLRSRQEDGTRKISRQLCLRFLEW